MALFFLYWAVIGLLMPSPFRSKSLSMKAMKPSSNNWLKKSTCKNIGTIDSNPSFPILTVLTLLHRLPLHNRQRFPRILILKLKDASFIGIYHMGVLILIVPFMAHSVRQVHMPMEKKFRPVFFQKPPKHLKALMGQIPPVIELICRRMGHQNIKSGYIPGAILLQALLPHN